MAADIAAHVIYSLLLLFVQSKLLWLLANASLFFFFLTAKHVASTQHFQNEIKGPPFESAFYFGVVSAPHLSNFYPIKFLFAVLWRPNIWNLRTLFDF